MPLIGAVLGFIFDNLRHSQRKHATPEAGGFVGPLFTLLGAVAKSDGRVSEQEIAVAERLMTRMGLDAEQRSGGGQLQRRQAAGVRRHPHIADCATGSACVATTRSRCSTW